MPSRADLDFFFNGQGLHTELAPTGTLQDFFRLQSVGQYTIEAHIQDWFVAPETEEYYSFGKFGITPAFALCAYEALDRMDKDGFDFLEYDQDGDNFIDSVIILHSGYVAEGGGIDCINNKTHGDHRIWSHATRNEGWISSDGRIQLGQYSTTSAVFGTCGSDIARVGIVGHEYLHTLGLPDLLGAEGRGVGIYDVMGMCWGVDGTLRYPATMGPWCRHFLGWVQPTRITTSGMYQIGTSQLYPDAYRIDVGFPDGEYLLIENRQKIYMDAIMPGEGGLLIWHIDDSKETDWQSAPGWPLQVGWPGNDNHYQIALLSPDGSYDIETGENYGDYFDCWTNGTSLEPGPGRQTAESDQLYMYPNTDAYSGGDIQSTGVRIYDISELGEIMSFRVEMPGSVPSPAPSPIAPSPTRTPTVASTKSPSTSSSSPGPSSPAGSSTADPTLSLLSPTVSPTERLSISIPPGFDDLSAPTVAPTTEMPMSIPPAFYGLPSLESVFATSGSLRLSTTALSVLTALVTAATMFGL
jgi:M6 family metalloprotease-like protein